MVKKATFIFLVLLFLSAYFLFQKTLCICPSDKEEFNELVKNTYDSNPTSKAVNQKRKNIQKDIYFSSDQDRYHTKITSIASDIELQLTNKKIKGAETLYDIEFWMQEKIERSSQKVKYCNAKQGKYFFPSHQFISDEVNLSFFHSKGKSLPEFFNSSEILMKATAKHIFFQLNNKGANFKADHIKAKLPEQLNQDIKQRVINAPNKKPQKKL